jgi:hypothetical protein
MVGILSNLFRQPHGYLVSNDPDPTKSKGQKAVEEFHTITCGHGGELVRVPAMCKPQDMPYALCWGCRRNICLKCADEMDRTGKCDVIENKLERIEAGNRMMREIGAR